ncbi:MAG: hypothetical protein AAGF04_02910 [Chlamydiota bacterium]
MTNLIKAQLPAQPKATLSAMYRQKEDGSASISSFSCDLFEKKTRLDGF